MTEAPKRPVSKQVSMKHDTMEIFMEKKKILFQMKENQEDAVQ